MIEFLLDENNIVYTFIYFFASLLVSMYLTKGFMNMLYTPFEQVSWTIFCMAYAFFFFFWPLTLLVKTIVVLTRNNNKNV